MLTRPPPSSIKRKPLVMPTMTGEMRSDRAVSAEKTRGTDEYDTTTIESSSSVNRVRKVSLNRSDNVQEGRLQLPVCKMEQEIVEAISDNDAVIICGETGSGKSTQIPQFLYEYGYCSGPHAKAGGGMIGITQPPEGGCCEHGDKGSSGDGLPNS